jgi:hypothetical protein
MRDEHLRYWLRRVTALITRAGGSDMRLMIINAEQSKVTVVQMDVPKKLAG